MVEQGEAVLQDRGMLGIPQESGSPGPLRLGTSFTFFGVLKVSS